MRRILLVSVLMTGAVASLSSVAKADPSLSDRETARSLMDDGDAKRDKGDHKGALKSYEAADAIMHVPTTGLEVARMQAQVGLLLEARETLGRVTRLPPKPGEPAPFAAARKTAETLSAELATRIPSVTVVIANAEPGATTQLTFDGEAVPPAASQAPRKVNPGRHTIVARAGSVEKNADLTINERESRTVTLDMKSIAAPAAPVKDEGDPVTAASGTSSLPKVLMIGGFTVGAIGVGVGAVTGLMSISKVSDVKKSCAGDVCPTDRQPDIDSAKSLGTISTIAFIAGGVGAGVGIIGIVLASKQSSSEVGTGAAPPRNHTARAGSPITVSADIGPTWLGLRGAF